MREAGSRAVAIKLPTLQVEILHSMGIVVPWVSCERQATSRTSQEPGVAVPKGAQPIAVSSTKITRESFSETRHLPENLPQETEVEQQSDREVDISRMSLSEIAQAISECKACVLANTRKNTVPGQGVLEPRLMVIGEGPGEQEDLQGLPFVGPSGRLLDNMLAAIGLSRQNNVYIANTVKCRPPGNRNPRDEEIKSCMPFLRRQIELLQPEAILAVGLFASRTLLESTAGVHALRSKDHVVQVAGRSIPVVVTFHPAYLLRKPADKRLAWQDMKKVWKILNS